MMNEQAYKAVEKMANEIFDQCIEYAEKERMPYSVVFRIVGDGLLKLSMAAEENGA